MPTEILGCVGGDDRQAEGGVESSGGSGAGGGIQGTTVNGCDMSKTDDLNRLLGLLNSPPIKPVPVPLTAKDDCTRKSWQWPVSEPESGDADIPQQSAEARALEHFSLAHKSTRDFSNLHDSVLISDIFEAIVRKRLNNSDWADNAPPENILRVLISLRILIRDVTYQRKLTELGGVTALSAHFCKATESYLSFGDGPYVVDILTEMNTIFQKLASAEEQRESIVASLAHESMVSLLSASDTNVLRGALHAMFELAQSKKARSLIAELGSIEVLLRMLEEYDLVLKRLAAKLLTVLVGDRQAREMVRAQDGVALLLSLLHSDSVSLLWHVVWCLVQLSVDDETREDVRQIGGIPLLLSLIHDRVFVSERATATINFSISSSSSCVPLAQEEIDITEQSMNLKAACCTCLTELTFNDANSQQIVQSNGIYYLALLVLTQKISEKDLQIVENLQAHALRTLRFLFSLERNRRRFKTLFPPSVFAAFIDIGSYKRDMGAYRAMIKMINNTPEEVIDGIRDSVNATNQNKAPSNFIGEYAVLELLGSGAFGSVYRVKKRTAGQSYLAMKEINTVGQSWGKTAKERQKSFGDAINELTIMREQMKHPNIVRYYKTFIEQDKLYIVMELIEGTPLGEHFNSLKEKGKNFSEERIWRIFVQMVLALRYLHKEKGIIHRDLTPNNIMLGENDKVTITDFGLAKQKQKDCSKMTSVVGTILYSCPEIVQNQPYGDKADVWALGCVLYQMCTLKPPFFSSNMLSLATKIVNADYEKLTGNQYSEKVCSTIKKCVTAKPDDRPDIVQVAAHIAEIILVHVDVMQREQTRLEKTLEREIKRRKAYLYDEKENLHKNTHRAFEESASQLDSLGCKLIDLSCSGEELSLLNGNADGNNGSSSDVTAASLGSRHSSERENEERANTLINEQMMIAWLSSDGDETCSSGGESRECSAGGHRYGNNRQAAHLVPRPPGGTPNMKRRGHRGGSGIEQYSHQLLVDIPGMKQSRDSGLSSDDPSPSSLLSSGGSSSLMRMNSRLSDDQAASSLISPQDTAGKEVVMRPRSLGTVPRSVSTTALESLQRSTTQGTSRFRPASATGTTLAISLQKVREIVDPVQQMLNILHKIIYITQLPPSLGHNARRRAVERFKRALFAQQANSDSLKTELTKLLQGSRELIDLSFGSGDSLKLAQQVSNEQSFVNANLMHKSGVGVYETDSGEVGITYEQMLSIIESLLSESGYYNKTPTLVSRQRGLAYTILHEASPASLINGKL